MRATTFPKVVFVSDRPRAREAKLAHGLRSAGWHVVLLHRHPPTFDTAPYFEACHRFGGPEEAVALARGFGGALFHVFALWGYDVAAALIKDRVGRVILDIYDVMAGMVQEARLSESYPGQLALEAFCLAEADGHCCRSLELQHAKRTRGARLRGPRLFFPDYCWDRGGPPPDRLPGVHVVYPGNVASRRTHPDNEGFGDLLWLGEVLAREEIHLHVYPAHHGDWEAFGSRFSDYIEMDRDSPWFHFHEPVAPDDLTDEISRCTAGVMVLGPRMQGTRGHPTYLPRKAHYATCNKMFDFLDAGLPAIVDENWLCRRMLARYRLAVRGRDHLRGDLRRALDQVIDGTFDARVSSARRAYSVAANTPRLEAFYREIA